MKETFVCSECGKRKSAFSLAEGALELAGTGDPLVALEALMPDELVCQHCEDTTDEDLALEDEDLGLLWGLGRTVEEAFELDGLVLDEGQRVAWMLNH